MADKYLYGVKGAKIAQDITVGTSSGSTTVELRVTDGAFANKIDLLLALEAIRDKIVQSTSVPG